VSRGLGDVYKRQDKRDRNKDKSNTENKKQRVIFTWHRTTIVSRLFFSVYSQFLCDSLHILDIFEPKIPGKFPVAFFIKTRYY